VWRVEHENAKKKKSSGAMSADDNGKSSPRTKAISGDQWCTPRHASIVAHDTGPRTRSRARRVRRETLPTPSGETVETTKEWQKRDEVEEASEGEEAEKKRMECV